MTEQQEQTEAANGQSELTAGLGWTRNREQVLWEIYSMKLSSSSSATALLLEKHGLAFFSRNFRPGSWKLTDKGLKLLFKWKPCLASPNVELCGERSESERTQG